MGGGCRFATSLSEFFGYYGDEAVMPNCLRDAQLVEFADASCQGYFAQLIALARRSQITAGQRPAARGGLRS